MAVVVVKIRVLSEVCCREGEAARGSCSSCASCLSLFLDRMNGMDRMGRGDSPAEAQGRRGFGAVTGEATGEGCVVGGRRSHSGKRQCEPRIARMTRISRDRDGNLRSSLVHPWNP